MIANLDDLLKFEGISRSFLEARIRTLVAEVQGHRDAVEQARQRLIIEGCLTCRGGQDYRLMSDNLTHCQERCTELLEETRSQRVELARLRVELDEVTAQRGWPAFWPKRDENLCPGWTCACGIFNGSAKAG